MSGLHRIAAGHPDEKARAACREVLEAMEIVVANTTRALGYLAPEDWSPEDLLAALTPESEAVHIDAFHELDAGTAWRLVDEASQTALDGLEDMQRTMI